MARTRIRGHNVMLFDEEGNSFAFGTNSSLTIDTNMISVSDKDCSIYGYQEPGETTWTVSSEHTLDMDEYYKFFDAQQTQAKLKIWYGVNTGWNTDAGKISEVNNGVDGVRTVDPTSYALTGYVFVQNLTQNASNGDFANYTVNFQGVGNLEKKKFTA